MEATIERKPLPFTRCFIKDGESPFWTPWAIRCGSFGCREAIYLTREHVAKEQQESREYYHREASDYKCPRCQTRCPLTEDNERPAVLELPVLNPSEHPGHRALMAHYANSPWLAERYFQRDLAYYARLSIEENGCEQFAVVARPGNLTIIGRGTTKAPERLLWEVSQYSINDILIWDGITLGRVETCYAEKWLCGEDDNRQVPEVPARVGTFRIPHYETLLSSLPYTLRKRLSERDEAQQREQKWEGRVPRGWTLKQAYEAEVLNMVSYAGQCETPYVTMSLFEGQGRQWQCMFSVSDKRLTPTGAVNFHLQNTSQWVYAGAIVIDADTGEVSTHH